MEICLEQLKKLPKIELHLHLDGSVRPSTVSEVLKRPLEEVKKEMIVDSSIHSLADYLKKFELPLSIMQTKENLKRITKELLEDLKEENVIYTELRFAPMLHTKKGLSQEEVLCSVLEAMNETSIRCNVILCCMRHDIEHANIHNRETIQLAYRYLNHGVVAVDLAGDEAHYPTILFHDLFTEMKNLDIPYTIHAGEASGYQSVDAAIYFHAKRIGHGIRAIENQNTIEKLIQHQITLEICPQSNVDTSLVSDKSVHPIVTLAKKILVTVNTDNRTVSQITLTEEYYDLITKMGFSIFDLKQMNDHAIECAFLKSEEKDKLKEIIEGGYYDTTY